MRFLFFVLVNGQRAEREKGKDIGFVDIEEGRWEQIASGFYVRQEGDRLYSVGSIPEGGWISKIGYPSSYTVEFGLSSTAEEAKEFSEQDIEDRLKYFYSITIDNKGNIIGGKKDSDDSQKIGRITLSSEPKFPRTIPDDGVITEAQGEELIKQIEDWRKAHVGVKKAWLELFKKSRCVCEIISIDPGMVNIVMTFSAPIEAVQTQEKIGNGIDRIVKESLSGEWDAEKEFDVFESVDVIERVGPSKVFVLIWHFNTIAYNYDFSSVEDYFRSIQEKGLDEYAFVGEGS